MIDTAVAAPASARNRRHHLRERDHAPLNGLVNALANDGENFAGVRERGAT